VLIFSIFALLLVTSPSHSPSTTIPSRYRFAVVTKVYHGCSSLLVPLMEGGWRVRNGYRAVHWFLVVSTHSCHLHSRYYKRSATLMFPDACSRNIRRVTVPCGNGERRGNRNRKLFLFVSFFDCVKQAIFDILLWLSFCLFLWHCSFDVELVASQAARKTNVLTTTANRN
jgi:hypothetical protein